MTKGDTRSLDSSSCRIFGFRASSSEPIGPNCLTVLGKALPGPLKYVELWPFGLFFGV